MNTKGVRRTGATLLQNPVIAKADSIRAPTKLDRSNLFFGEGYSGALSGIILCTAPRLSHTGSGRRTLKRQLGKETKISTFKQ
jgi:hypothetical protein